MTTNRRILMIDDEEMVLNTIRRYLVGEEYDVVTATSGKEGLALMRREPFRVVLTDIKMPGMDGLEVLARLREEYPLCEVIIISGHGEMSHAIEALRQGAYNYLQKPLDLDEVVIAVERAFVKHEQAEQFREIQDQLYHAQKMESLGTLAGGVAHEFNNLMGGIIGYCEMALNGGSEELREKAINTSLKAATRAGEISQNLLRFARRVSTNPRPVDVNQIISDTVQLLRMDLESERITMEINLSALPVVRADMAQLQQVFLNLIINARQSLQQIREGRRAITITSKAENNNILISISDNGIGIKEEDVNKVFEPFYTTRGVLHGGDVSDATGLGLSVVDGIIRSHGGKIELLSTPGERTEFTITLPSEAGQDRKKNAKVMVVDDDPALLRIISAILENAGLRVVCCANGKTALDLVEKDLPDMVILDHNMPGMDGMEVLRQMNSMAPCLPIIMLTALHTPDRARQAVLMGARECIAKPINNDKLLFLARKYAARDDTYVPENMREKNPVRPESKHILVVDDDDTIRDVYGLVLSRSGFRVSSAHNGNEAATMTENTYFDLIIVDMLMPGMNGPASIRAIRANNPYTPIIISTGDASDHLLRDGLQAGASRVLLKPVNPEALIREVMHLLTIYAQQVNGGNGVKL